MIQTFKSKLISKKNLTNSVVEFLFEKPKDFTFIPGQYVILNVPCEGSVLKRLYSIGSVPAANYIALYIELLPNGKASNVLKKVNIGEEFIIQAPAGRFILKDTQKVKVFIATGTGIVPFLSMIPHTNVPTYVFWGLRTKNDAFLVSYIDELQKKHNHVTHSYYYSKEDLNNLTDKEYSGRVHKGVENLVEKLSGEVKNTEWYLCGSHGMIDDMVNFLSKIGIDKENIHHEKFTNQTMTNLFGHDL